MMITSAPLRSSRCIKEASAHRIPSDRGATSNAETHSCPCFSRCPIRSPAPAQGSANRDRGLRCGSSGMTADQGVG